MQKAKNGTAGKTARASKEKTELKTVGDLALSFHAGGVRTRGTQPLRPISPEDAHAFDHSVNEGWVTHLRRWTTIGVVFVGDDGFGELMYKEGATWQWRKILPDVDVVRLEIQQDNLGPEPEVALGPLARFLRGT